MLYLTLPWYPGARPYPPFRGQIRPFWSLQSHGYILRRDPCIYWWHGTRRGKKGDLCIKRHRHRSWRMHDHQSRYEYNRMSICIWNHTNIPTSSAVFCNCSVLYIPLHIHYHFKLTCSAISNAIQIIHRTDVLMTQMDLLELSYIKVHCTRLQEASIRS